MSSSNAQVDEVSLNDDDLAYAKATIIMLNCPFEYSLIKVVRGRVQLMDSNGSTRILSAGEEFFKKWEPGATEKITVNSQP